MIVYEAVTADAYELPLIQADTANALADKLGIRRGSVYRAIARGSENREGYRIIKVEYEEEEV